VLRVSSSKHEQANACKPTEYMSLHLRLNVKMTGAQG
jgi:hypothetical protein